MSAAQPSISKVTEFWDSRPCNIRHSKSPIGTRKYFDEVERRKYFIEPHILPFADFPKWKGKRVLEIGCGLGTAAVGFIRAGAKYTGVDLSEKSLELARQRFEVYGLKGELHAANCEKLSKCIPVRPYDLVYSFGVLHHTPNPRKAFQEIHKFMHAKSVLKVMLYAKNSWKDAMIRAGLDQPEAQTGCPIAYTYEIDELPALLKGFEIVSVEQDHIFPYKIEEYKQYKYVRQPWFEAMPKEMFRSLEKQLGWHLLITAKLSKK